MISLKEFFGTDRFFSLLLAVGAVIAFIIIGNGEEVSSPGELRASTYPRLILAGLIAACALHMSGFGNGSAKKAAFPWKGLMAIAIIAAYIVLLEPVGYFLLTPVVLIILPLLAGYRNCPVVLFSCLFIMACLYAVFGVMLRIPLPLGWLGGI